MRTTTAEVARAVRGRQNINNTPGYHVAAIHALHRPLLCPGIDQADDIVEEKGKGKYVRDTGEGPAHNRKEEAEV